jgi:hypothetical protein
MSVNMLHLRNQYQYNLALAVKRKCQDTTGGSLRFNTKNPTFVEIKFIVINNIIVWEMAPSGLVEFHRFFSEDHIPLILMLEE